MVGLLVFESFSKRRTPGVCGAMSKMFVGGCWYFLEKCWKTGGKRTRCPRQPTVDMDVDCRRPRHDENHSSLFVENSHPETLHRDMCIACSGSSWILPMYFTNSQVNVKTRCRNWQRVLNFYASIMRSLANSPPLTSSNLASRSFTWRFFFSSPATS